MNNLYTKFVKISEIHKHFSENLVKEHGNIPHRSPVPKLSDSEVLALSRESVAGWDGSVIERRLPASGIVLPDNTAHNSTAKPTNTRSYHPSCFFKPMNAPSQLPTPHRLKF